MDVTAEYVQMLQPFEEFAIIWAFFGFVKEF